MCQVACRHRWVVRSRKARAAVVVVAPFPAFCRRPACPPPPLAAGSRMPPETHRGFLERERRPSAVRFGRRAGLRVRESTSIASATVAGEGNEPASFCDAAMPTIAGRFFGAIVGLGKAGDDRGRYRRAARARPCSSRRMGCAFPQHAAAVRERGTRYFLGICVRGLTMRYTGACSPPA